MYGFKNGIKAHSVSIVDSEWSPHEPDQQFSFWQLFLIRFIGYKRK